MVNDQETTEVNDQETTDLFAQWLVNDQETTDLSAQANTEAAHLTNPQVAPTNTEAGAAAGTEAQANTEAAHLTNPQAAPTNTEAEAAADTETQANTEAAGAGTQSTDTLNPIRTPEPGPNGAHSDQEHVENPAPAPGPEQTPQNVQTVQTVVPENLYDPLHTVQQESESRERHMSKSLAHTTGEQDASLNTTVGTSAPPELQEDGPPTVAALEALEEEAFDEEHDSTDDEMKIADRAMLPNHHDTTTVIDFDEKYTWGDAKQLIDHRAQEYEWARLQYGHMKRQKDEMKARLKNFKNVYKRKIATLEATIAQREEPEQQDPRYEELQQQIKTLTEQNAAERTIWEAKQDSEAEPAISDETRQDLENAAQNLLFATESALGFTSFVAERVIQPNILIDANGKEVHQKPTGFFIPQEVTRALHHMKKDAVTEMIHATASTLGVKMAPYDIPASVYKKALEGKTNLKAISTAIQEQWKQEVKDNPEGTPRSTKLDRALPALQALPRYARDTMAEYDEKDTQPTASKKTSTPQKNKGTKGVVTESGAMQIAHRRQKADTQIGVAPTHEDLKRAQATDGSRWLFTNYNIWIPPTAKSVADDEYDNAFAARFCTAAHATGLLALLGINIKSCTECGKGGLNLRRLDFAIPPLANYLFLAVGKGINKTAFLVDENLDRLRVADSAANLQKYSKSLFGDKEAWKKGKDYVRQHINLPTSISEELKLVALSNRRTDGLITGTDLSGLRKQAGSSKPIVPLDLVRRVHQGLLPQTTLRQLPKAAAKNNTPEQDRIIAFHVKRLTDAFDIDPEITMVEDPKNEPEEEIPLKVIVERILAALSDAGATKEGLFDPKSHWIVKADILAYIKSKTVQDILLDIKMPTKKRKADAIEAPDGGPPRVAPKRNKTGKGTKKEKSKGNKRISFKDWPEYPDPSTITKENLAFTEEDEEDPVLGEMDWKPTNPANEFWRDRDGFIRHGQKNDSRSKLGKITLGDCTRNNVVIPNTMVIPDVTGLNPLPWKPIIKYEKQVRLFLNLEQAWLAARKVLYEEVKNDKYNEMTEEPYYYQKWEPVQDDNNGSGENEGSGELSE
ncbi:hypothetical protein HBH70_011690 [Parastagonospora nodorum]|nr:hypothetical protein HBH52_015980 [Parastagonospora nodorum]KAH4859669.1 hypothetical protein HBH75_041580 [Parastagonospora nodorum]KAH5151859.1 hypothetical protein HBH70_011690 [Parastagonospora nodorum]KAH5466554.1 hypothetical protein HBI28_212610 [Parastagonospora nodorum]KAH5622892.1 hypothetical protein HBI22_181730 [Parastagonospora nodorum]